jgi:dTDP-4-amino-4,6-dideoxygalactose transaminase
MNVPLLDLKAQNGALESELQEAFLRVLRSGHFILGPEVDQFEESLAKFTGARYALGISSGTDAILVALMALGIGPGDEVLCPTFTFFATAGCVSRLGARPVFVDSLPDSFNIDPEDAARRITARTRAILPVHLFGQAAAMDAIFALARQHGLRVVEDAAQALGATYEIPIRPEEVSIRHPQVGTLTGYGSLGGFGTISFFPSKNLGALGDGGALLTNDADLFERSRILRTHGMDPKYFHPVIGGNFRLDALQAAFLGVKLRHYDEYTARRRRNAALYDERLGVLPAAQGPSPALILPAVSPGNGHIWNQYTVRVTGAGARDELRAHLTARGIGTEIYYPLPLHEQACFRSLGYKADDFPVAHRLAGEVLSLPIFPELETAAIEEVCRVITEFFARRAS